MEFVREAQPVTELLFSSTWNQQRLGKFTASEIWKLLKAGKKKDEMFGCTAKTYIDEKVAEILTREGRSLENVFAIQWGTQYEPEAVEMFRRLYGHDVVYYGKENPKFFEHNDYSGGSPDGIVDAMQVLEVKCPENPANHIAALRAAKSDNAVEWFKEKKEEYYAQIQFNMLCTKLNEGLFLSYQPKIIDHRKRIATIMIPRDDQFIDNLMVRIDAASKILEQTLKIINE